MPGHDEETVRKAREDEAATNNPAMGDTGLGGTGRTGDIGAGGALGGDDAMDRTEGMGGIGDTGMTNAEAGSGAQNRMTTGIGAAGDQTDEELLEGR